MIVRYVILSPSEEARQAFLGSLFGTFELSPRGHGEKVTFSVEGGDLEIVGTGVEGRLKDMALKLLEGGVQVDGILFLIPSGDTSSWSEAEAVSQWARSNDLSILVNTRGYDSLSDLNKEAARETLMVLINEHEQNVAAG